MKMNESIYGPNVNRRRREREDRKIMFASEEFVVNSLLEIKELEKVEDSVENKTK